MKEGNVKMIFNYNNQKEVVALLGAGSMGMAIVERVAQNRPGAEEPGGFSAPVMQNNKP